MNAILNDKTYIDSYLVIKEARVAIESAIDRTKPGGTYDGLYNQYERYLKVAASVSDRLRKAAGRSGDVSDAISAAAAASELNLLQSAHPQRCTSATAAIGPAEMNAFEREFKRLLLLIVEMVNALITMIAKIFGVDLPLIDDESIRTAVYGNDDYRRAKYGDPSVLHATSDTMQKDFAATLNATAEDQTPTTVDLAKQVRSYLSRSGGTVDLINDDLRAFLDDLTRDERAALSHASGNQIIEHLRLEMPVEGVRPYRDHCSRQMTI